MKIIVKSEAEKDLIERFVEELKSSDIVREISHDAKLSDDEGDFVYNGLFYSEIEVGQTEALLMNGDNFESICSDCGKTTHGVRNKVTITLDEYVSYKNEAGMYWVCDSCL